LKAKKASASAKSYTDKFMSEAVARIKEQGYSVREVSDHPGEPLKSMYKWLSHARGGVSKATEDLRIENTRLRSEMKRVQADCPSQTFTSKNAIQWPGIIHLLSLWAAAL
jgi:transposase-like protein